MIDTVVQLLPLAAPLLLALWQSSAAGATRTLYQPWIKLAWLAFIFRDRWAEPDVAMSMVFGGALAMLWRTREIRWNATFGLGALLILFAYCAVPFVVFGSANADTRLLPVLPVLLMAVVLAMAPPGDEHRRIATFVAIGCVAVAVIRIALVGASFMVAAREQAAVLPAIDRNERGARVAIAVGDQCANWSLHRSDHFGSLAIVRREAFSNDQWFLPGSVAVEIHYPPRASMPTTQCNCSTKDVARRLNSSNGCADCRRRRSTMCGCSTPRRCPPNNSAAGARSMCRREARCIVGWTKLR